MRRLALALAVIALLPASALGQSKAALDRALSESLAGQPASPGMSAALDGPGLRWSGAVGVFDRASGSPLRPGDGYRIASITKAFTAVATLRLAERGRLSLDAPIARYLPRLYLRTLRGDGYDPGRITVRQLLQHTSGLFDYATTDAYTTEVLTDPGHRWTRIEQVRFAMAQGDPIAAPGRRFAYSDTGYVLLGQIIESRTGRSQAAAYRGLLRFRALGLRATYFETLEPKPRGAPHRAHQYFGAVDTFGLLDASHDLYGGGGLVSTTGDLNRFFRALFEGELIGRRSLRALTSASGQSGRFKYGFGVYRVRTAVGTCVGHDGFWGSFSAFCPSRGLAVSVTVNSADADAERVALRLLRVAG